MLLSRPRTIFLCSNGALQKTPANLNNIFVFCFCPVSAPVSQVNMPQNTGHAQSLKPSSKECWCTRAAWGLPQSFVFRVRPCNMMASHWLPRCAPEAATVPQLTQGIACSCLSLLSTRRVYLNRGKWQWYSGTAIATPQKRKQTGTAWAPWTLMRSRDAAR